MKEITIDLNEAAIGCEFCPDSDRKICSAVGDYYCPVVTLRIAGPDEVIIPVKTLKQWAKIIREYYLCTSPADLKRKERMGNVLTAITAESLKGG